MFLLHYRATGDGWRTFNLCAECCRDCTPSIQRFVNKCTYQNSCKCNLCLRQPPTLRDLASHSVFHLNFNFLEFQLTARKLYHNYLHAANSHHVPEHKLIPHKGICLQSPYAHSTLCERGTRFHEYYIQDREVCWRSFDNEHYGSYEEVIATLCFDRNRLWCPFCEGPIFIPAQCRVEHMGQ